MCYFYFYVSITTKNHYFVENSIELVTYGVEVEFHTLHIVSLVSQYIPNASKFNKQ